MKLKMNWVMWLALGLVALLVLSSKGGTQSQPIVSGMSVG